MNDNTLTIDQLITGLTPLQVKGKIYQILAELGVSTTNWKPGAVVRLIISAVSIILSKFSLLIALIARSAFLNTSVSNWLTLVAYYYFGTPRNPATAASGPVIVTNSGGGTFDYAVGALVIANDLTGKTYRNQQEVVLGVGYPTPVSTTVTFAADELGTASNAIPGQITTVVTAANGLSVVNTYALVANDVETDAALITRAQLKPQSLSPDGPSGAYYYFALTATRQDGTAVGVNRCTVYPYSTTGQANVIVASPAGSVPGTVDDPTTDLGAVFASLVKNALPEAVTLGLTTATTVNVDVSFWAYFDPNTIVPPSVQQAIASAAVLAWFGSQQMPIGGFTIPNVIANTIPRDTLRDIISDAFVVANYPRPLLVKIYTPATDVYLTTDQVPEPGNIVAQAA